VWDLDTGAEVTAEGSHHGIFRWSLRAGQEDKRLYGLAIGKLEAAIRVAFASSYGKVMVGNFGEPDPAAEVWDFKEWRIPNSAGGYSRSLAVGRTTDAWLLAAGTEYGQLVVWDFLTGAMSTARQGAHLGPIDVLFFNQDGKILVSGGRDGRVKFWTAGLQALFDINIGEEITTATWLDNNRLAIGTNRGALMLDINQQRMVGLIASLR
jgi:WD40 repeat protein